MPTTWPPPRAASRSASCTTLPARSGFGGPRIVPKWNEGGYGAGQYDAGLVVDAAPPPDPTTTVTGPVPLTTARAIERFWGVSSLPALTSDGKLWYGEAPIGTATPYAVLIPVAEPETARTTAFAVFEGTYQINCMHDRLQDAEEMADQVWSTFNNATLIRNGQPVLFCLSGMQSSRLGVQLGTDGRDCWVAFVEIQVLFTR